MLLVTVLLCWQPVEVASWILVPPRRQLQHIQLQPSTIRLQVQSPKPPQRKSSFGSGISFVEEGTYDSMEEEIEAMGGDPFFLDSSAEGNPEDDEKNSDPDFEWDGTVDEDAHLD